MSIFRINAALLSRHSPSFVLAYTLALVDDGSLLINGVDQQYESTVWINSMDQQG